MEVHVFVIGLLFCSYHAASGVLTEPHHANLNQSASVGCSLGNGTDGYLTFYLELNGDTVSRVYTVNQTDLTVTTAETYSSSTTNITGDGSAGNPFTFTLSVTNINTPDITILDSGVIAYTKGEDTVSVHVMAKYLYDPLFKDNIVFSNDVIYDVSCNFSLITDQTVTTNYLNVSGSVIETPTALVEVAVLEVKSASTDLAVASIPIGENIYLQAGPTQPSKANGTYVHSCYICDAADCQGSVSLLIIDSNGCSTVSYISKFQPGTMASARTLSFEAFTMSNKNNMYFQCMVNMCYSPDQPECIDLCAASTAPGRRKREAEQMEPDQLLTVSLKVFTGEEGLMVTVEDQNEEPIDVFAANILNQQSEVEEQTTREKEMLLYAVVVLSALLVVGLIITSLVFFRLRKRNAKQ